MQSAREHPQIIDDYLLKESTAGHILGPFSPHAMPNIHINRFGIIPKNPRWKNGASSRTCPSQRDIVLMMQSRPCTLQYISVDQVALAVMQLGRGALLAKTDIKAAYRLIPVHPSDRVWLGMKWNNLIYVDTMLPFGLSSASKLFNAVADALEWYICRQGVKYIHHYLDDFVAMSPPGSSECQEYLHTLERECAYLGIPLASEKREGPKPVITFLGIIIDTLQGQLCLPEDKLQRMMQMMTEWLPCKVCIRKELESLIGTLQHTCKVIRPGRSFLRRAISLLSVAKRPHHHIRLNHEFKSDLMWWKVFSSHWNGASLLIAPQSTPQVMLTSDASGAGGCGAWSESACLCFFGFFHSGEITVPSTHTFDPAVHLSWGDVAVDNPMSPTAIRVHLKRSKCDQFGTSVEVFVGRTNTSICPVVAVLAYIAARGASEGPFFRFTNGQLLSKQAFVSNFCQALQAIGQFLTKTLWVTAFA